MNIQEQISINASKEQIWEVIIDIDRAAERISGIEEIEVLERPNQGIIGLKWKETRTMFGKTATEIMWITEAEENAYYQTRAENHGAIYTSRLAITEASEGTSLLTMSFGAETPGLLAKIMSATLGQLFKGATVKAIRKDLEDIKANVEGQSTPS